MKKDPNDNLSEIDKRRLEEYKKNPQANLKDNIDRAQSFDFSALGWIEIGVIVAIIIIVYVINLFF